MESIAGNPSLPPFHWQDLSKLSGSGEWLTLYSYILCFIKWYFFGWLCYFWMRLYFISTIKYWICGNRLIFKEDHEHWALPMMSFAYNLYNRNLHVFQITYNENVHKKYIWELLSQLAFWSIFLINQWIMLTTLL